MNHKMFANQNTDSMWQEKCTQGGVVAGLQPPPPNPSRSQLRKADFVDMITSEVLLDLPFSRSATEIDRRLVH